MDASTILSVVAIVVSLTTAWFSLFHKGTVYMTRPGTFALLASDGPSGQGPKVFLRGLLCTTGKRGHAVESMFVKLLHDGHEQPFSFWAYGEQDKLVPSSGFFVGPEGRETNHHFLLARDVANFQFEPGSYILEVYGTLAGQLRPTRLQRLDFVLSPDEQKALGADHNAGVLFSWDPSIQAYVSQLESWPATPRTASVSGSGQGSFPWERQA